MRNFLAILVAVLLSGLGLVQTAAAQTARQGGMFYNPSFGRSFQPRPSSFGGGFETGASGNFLYPTRANGTGFAAPWRPAPLPVAPVGQASAVERVLQMGPVGAAPQPANVVAATPVAVAPLAAPNPTTATLPANITDGAATRRPLRHHRAEPRSERIGQRGRRRGAVRLFAHPVVIDDADRAEQGRARRARHQGLREQSHRADRRHGQHPARRNLLANVLGLEPGMSRIDNRLTVGYQPSSMPAVGP